MPTSVTFDYGGIAGAVVETTLTDTDSLSYGGVGGALIAVGAGLPVTDLLDDLVSGWPMTEASNTTRYDAYNGNPAIDVNGNVELSAFLLSGGAYFDPADTNSILRCADYTDFNHANTFEMSGWLRFWDTPTGRPICIGGSSGTSINWTLIVSGGNLVLRRGLVDTTNQDLVLISSVAVDTTYFVEFAIDYAASTYGTMYGWCNGSAITPVALPSAGRVNTRRLTFGGHEDGGAIAPCRLAHWQYFNALQTSGAKSYLYNSGSGVAFEDWDYVEGSGETVTNPLAEAAVDTQNPTVVLGSISIANPQATAVLGSQAPAVVLGNISVSNPQATAAFASQNPTVVLSDISVSNPQVAAAFDTQNPTVVLSGITVSNPRAAVAANTQTPTVVLGSLSVTPTVVTAAFDTQNPTIDTGSIIPTPAAAGFGTQNPTVVLGSITTTAIVTAAFDTQNPTVVFGSIAVTPAVASAAFDTQNPTVVLGAITPDVATAGFGTQNPTVILGSISVSPQVTFAVNTQSPTIVFGSIAVTPVQISAAFDTQNPTIAFGVAYTPTPSSFATACQAPSVVLGSIVVTTTLTVSLSTPAPTVIQSSITVSPDPISFSLDANINEFRVWFISEISQLVVGNYNG